MTEKNIAPNLRRKPNIHTETVVRKTSTVYDTGTYNRHFTITVGRRYYGYRMDRERNCSSGRFYLGNGTDPYQITRAEYITEPDSLKK